MVLRQEGDETGKAQANKGAAGGHLTKGVEDMLWRGLAALGCSSEPQAGELVLVLENKPERGSDCTTWEAEEHAPAAMGCGEEEGTEHGGATLARRVYRDRSCGGI
ncbi:hypothetical protein ZWY2020_010821 [Hordeum vulgare]|nr:hypothetical protein ZWY2020_010821 [Hordeum vulgare]